MRAGRAQALKIRPTGWAHFRFGPMPPARGRVRLIVVYNGREMDCTPAVRHETRVAYIGSHRPAESVNVSSHGNTGNVSTMQRTLEITCVAPQSFHLVDRYGDFPAQIRSQPPRPVGTPGAPLDRSARVRRVLIWLQDNGVA